MSFEGFFGKKKTNDDEASSEKIDASRRRFLKGSAAFAVGSLAFPALARADALLSELTELNTPEEKEANAELIQLYAQWIKHNEGALAQARTRQEIESIIYRYVPALEEHVLEGTELDYKPFLEEGGWPSGVHHFEIPQVNQATGKTVYESNYANNFVVNDTVISNRHAFQYSPGCETSNVGLDIAGCSLNNEAIVPPAERSSRTQLEWDPNKANENLHGKVVFVTANLKTPRGEVIHKLIPAVLVRITPNFLYTQENPEAYFSQGNTVGFGHELMNSYMAVVAVPDINQDGTRGGSDVVGTSGSPVIELEDCKAGKKAVSGIVWGTTQARDPNAKVARALMFIHGPEAIGGFLDQVGKNFGSGEAITNMETLTRKIQAGINQWRQARRLEPITVDGIYGQDTKLALYEIQKEVLGMKNRGTLYESGVINEATWHHLFPGEPYIDYLTLPQ